MSLENTKFSDVHGITNLVEEIKIWRLVKFLWILFSSHKGEVENVSDNQRSDQPYRFSDWFEKHKLVAGVVATLNVKITLKDKNEDIWPSPMTKAPTTTEMSKGQSDNTNNAKKKVRLNSNCGPT